MTAATNLTPVDVTTGPTFAAADFGPWSELRRHVLDVPAFGRQLPGKVFLKEPLGLTGLEVSLTSLPPGFAVPFLHRHQAHEELYLALQGEGELLVDGRVLPLRPGTAVRVAPEGARTIRASAAGPLVYACIQARAGAMTDAETITDGQPVAEPPRWS